MAKRKPGGEKVTKGPGGKEVKFKPGQKHVQVLRSIILRVIDGIPFETEMVDGEEVMVVFHKHLFQKLTDLKEGDPKTKINLLLDNGYLVIRSQAPEELSYYVFKFKTHGQRLKKKIRVA